MAPRSPLFCFVVFAVMSSSGIEEIEEEEEEEAVCVECMVALPVNGEWEQFGEQVLEIARQIYDHEEEDGGGAGVI